MLQFCELRLIESTEIIYRTKFLLLLSILLHSRVLRRRKQIEIMFRLLNSPPKYSIYKHFTWEIMSDVWIFVSLLPWIMFALHSMSVFNFVDFLNESIDKRMQTDEKKWKKIYMNEQNKRNEKSCSNATGKNSILIFPSVGWTHHGAVYMKRFNPVVLKIFKSQKE